MPGKVGSVAIHSEMVENVGVAVGISTISHSVPEKHSTSGIDSAILNYGGRLMSANVGNVTIGSGMVENVGLIVGISVISHFIPEKQCTSGLKSVILNYGARLTSANVGNVTIGSGMVENVGVAVGISTISHSVPEIQFTSGLQSAILKYDGRLTSRTVQRCQLCHRCFGHGRKYLGCLRNSA